MRESNVRHAVGIDVGGTTFAAGLFTADGQADFAKVALATSAEMVANDSWDTPTTDAHQVVAALIDGIHQILAVAKTDISQLSGITVAVPGNVDRSTGLIIECPNLPIIDGVNIVDAFQEAIGDYPVFVANDAYCATLGELRYGAGRDVENLLMLTLGTGIGGGIALDNQVCRGPRNMMGEIGHMIIVPDGPRCGCGNIGCFEAVAGKQAIIDLARRQLQYARQSLIDQLCGGDPEKITPQVVAEAARRGDEVAVEVMNKIGYYIGLALCNGIIMCDPDVIVLGGGIAAAGEVLFAPVRRTVHYRSPYSGFDVNNIVPAQLGNQAGIYGAAALVWENLG